MTVKNLQQEVDTWIKQHGVRYFDNLTNMAILTEEVGELASLMARIHGEQSFKKPMKKEQFKSALADEMTDVLWVLICLANQNGIDLEDSMLLNLKKKTQRDKDRHKSNQKL